MTNTKARTNKKLFALLLTTVLLAFSGQAANAQEAVNTDGANIQNQISENFDSLGNVTPAPRLSCEEARFVKLINLYRNSLKLSTLKVAQNGVTAARWHSRDMGVKRYFDHTEPSGRNAFQRMNSFNYPGQGENIAAGYKDANKVFCGWKKSPGHDKNMRSPRWTTLSIGLVATAGSRFTNYWNTGFSSKVTALLAEPLTTLATCAMPTALPKCL